MKTNNSERTFFFLDSVPVLLLRREKGLSCRSCIWGWRWTWRRTWWPCWRPPGSPSRWRSSCVLGWQTCRPLCTRCGSRRLAGRNDRRSGMFFTLGSSHHVETGKLWSTSSLDVETGTTLIDCAQTLHFKRQTFFFSDKSWHYLSSSIQQCTLVVTDQNRNCLIHLNTWLN